VFISFGCARNQPLIALVYYKQRERVVRESKLRGKNTRIELSFPSRNVTSEDPNFTYTKEEIYKLIANYHDERSSCFFSALG
jgi:transposase